MTSPLPSLIDLRREAESQAFLALKRVMAEHAREVEKEARLLAGWRRALAVAQPNGGPASTLATAAQAMTRDRYRRDLAQAVARAARLLQAHRRGPLAQAAQAESTARSTHQQARRELEAALKLQQREAARAAELARRRDEDVASDLANAAFVRGRRP
jgi:flagellar biosynthesis chaperone FliJ